MLIYPGPLQEVEFKLSMRDLYKTKGGVVCLQVLYEFLIAGQWLAEVMIEERNKEKGE